MATEPTKASDQPIPKTSGGDKMSEEPEKSDGSKADDNNRRRTGSGGRGDGGVGG